MKRLAYVVRQLVYLWLIKAAYRVCPPRTMPDVVVDGMVRVLGAVAAERGRQDRQHGAQQDLPIVRPGERLLDPEAVLKARYERRKRSGTLSHGDIILEELAEAFDAPDYASMREELVQAAACIVKAIEALDWQQKRKGET